MARVAPDRKPLLQRSSSTEQTVIAAHEDSDYGAIGNNESGDPPKPVEVKQAKTFREIWPLCLGLWTAIVFCSALGATIIANLQIEIGSYFRAGSLASWLGTAYLLGVTCMTPLYGRLAQVMGRKGAMMLAMSFFSVGTLMCAIAPSMYFILGARYIAGAGSGGLLTVTAIIISDLVSLADRGLYQGGVNVLFGLGAALGAVVGGWVADVWGWRMAFWMQLVPIGLSTILIVTQVHVPHVKGDLSAWEKFKRIDWLGSAVLLVNISALSVAASLFSSSRYSITSPWVYGLLITFGVTLPLFVWIENKAKEPILPMSLLTRLQPSMALSGFFLLTAANFPRIYFQPIYLHVTRGLNGGDTGLLLLPSSIVGSASSLYAGWHMRHWKEYKWFQFTVSLIPWLQGLSIIASWGPDTNRARLAFEMAVGAFGGGAVITSLLTTLVACVEPEEMSLAISAGYLFRAIGQVVGVAVAAAIQQSVLLADLQERLADYPPDLISRIIDEPTTIMKDLPPWVALQAKMAYLRSIEGVFIYVVVGGVALSTLCLLVRPRPL